MVNVSPINSPAAVAVKEASSAKTRSNAKRTGWVIARMARTSCNSSIRSWALLGA